MIRSFAFAYLFAAAAPALSTTTQSGGWTTTDGSRTMTQSAEVDAPLEEVWRAISTASGWERWAVAIAWQRGSRPRIIETSYDPQAKPGDPQTIRHVLIRERPLRSISFRTIKAPTGFEDFDTYTKIVNTIDLKPIGRGRTRVRITAGPYPDTSAGRRLYAFFAEGNRKTLDNLAEVLGKGAANRFNKGEK